MKYTKKEYNIIMIFIDTSTIKFFNKLFIILFLSIISIFIFIYLLEYMEHFSSNNFISVDPNHSLTKNREVKDSIITIYPFKTHKRTIPTDKERLAHNKQKNMYKINRNVDKIYNPKPFTYNRNIKKKKTTSMKKRQLISNNYIYGKISNDRKLESSHIYHERNKYINPTNKNLISNRQKKMSDRNKETKITKNAERIIKEHDKNVKNDPSGTYVNMTINSSDNIDNIINNIIEEDEIKEHNNKNNKSNKIELS
jgi:hypothetical protein